MNFIRNIRKLLINAEKNGNLEFKNEFKMPINEEFVIELKKYKIDDLIIKILLENDAKCLNEIITPSVLLNLLNDLPVYNNIKEALIDSINKNTI